MPMFKIPQIYYEAFISGQSGEWFEYESFGIKIVLSGMEFEYFRMQFRYRIMRSVYKKYIQELSNVKNEEK